MKMWGKTVNVFSTLTRVSEFSKIQMNIEFSKAMQPDAIPVKELDLVKSLVKVLHVNKTKYEEAIL